MSSTTTGWLQLTVLPAGWDGKGSKEMEWHAPTLTTLNPMELTFGRLKKEP